MQVKEIVRDQEIWAIVMRGNANKMCWKRDYWTFFAVDQDIPWPVAHATVGTGEYATSMGSKAKAYIDWIDVPENQRREGWATRAVTLMRRFYASIDYTSNDTEIANAFWDSIERHTAEPQGVSTVAPEQGPFSASSASLR